MAKRGRPKKILTKEQVEQLEKLAAVLTQEQIADFFGMSERTLRQRMTEDPEISAAYARGRAVAFEAVGMNLLQQAREGNVRAMEFYLKTQVGWKETQHVEHSGRIDLNRLNELTDEELARLAAGEELA